MESNFGSCFNETDHWEGGYVDNPHDPGGATCRGVTQRVYDAYRRSSGRNTQSVRAIGAVECLDIYRRQYWIPAHGADLPAGLDLAQYDEAVNTGPVEATKLLQQALGVPVDGVFGLLTLSAVQRCSDVPSLIRKVCAARLSFYHRLRGWVWFGVGWNARDVGIQAKALEMFAASQKTPSASG